MSDEEITQMAPGLIQAFAAKEKFESSGRLPPPTSVLNLCVVADDLPRLVRRLVFDSVL